MKNTIYTLTLSPAIDVEYHSVSAGEGLNRTYSHAVFAGGKGINVSRSIARCAEKSGSKVNLRTVFPYGGDVGELLCSVLKRENMGELCGARCALPTRINTSLIPDAGREIEINAPGTAIGEKIHEIEDIILGSLSAGDVVCVCGSVPVGVPKSYPAELCAKVKRLGGIAVLDCDGEAMAIAAKAEKGSAADLIKPNTDEFFSLTGTRVKDETEFSEACGGLPFSSVIMTMAGEGSMYCGGGECFTVSTQARRVVRLKGAGDTFLGAYVYSRWCEGNGSREAMEYATAVAGDYVAGENE